jgi:hypothetical protein
LKITEVVPDDLVGVGAGSIGVIYKFATAELLGS